MFVSTGTEQSTPTYMPAANRTARWMAWRMDGMRCEKEGKIWEVDPLSCPRCSHEMKIISLIHEPDAIERILHHLGLWKQPPDPHKGKIKGPVDEPVVVDDFDDGWPGYEKPVLVYH